MVFFSPPGSAWVSTKTLRVLRMTAVLIVGFVIQVSASFSQAVTLKVKNAPLKEVLAEVKKQTGYSFFYNAELLADAKPVTLDVQKASLADVLKAAFNGQSLNYVIENKTVFISRSVKAKAVTDEGVPFYVNVADPVKIRVTGADGQPLSGATVVLKKSKKSAVTDAQGNLTLNADAGDIVTVSYVGYVTQDIKIGQGQNTLMVSLQTKTDTNEEVVVMAYGQKKKRSEVVGSAFQINADKIANMPAVRLDAILEGQMPGVSVTLNNDGANSTKQRLNIRVRGTGSFNASNEPLWVIDGTPVYTGDNTNLIPGIQTGVTPLSYINPEDIESITILKDASAAAIYGSNASNGVILVTTKSGKKGKPQWGVSLQNGFSHINENTKFKTLNASEYMELAKESWLNSGKDMTTFPYNDNELNKYSTTNTDWVDQYYGVGVVNNLNLNLSGGTKKLEYRASGGYYNNKSTIKGNTQNRASVMASLRYNISEKLTVALISRYSYNKNNNFNPSQDYIQFLPIYSPYNDDGTYRLYNRRIDGADGSGNPIYINQRFLNSVAAREENDDYQNTNLFNNNFMVDWKILKNLQSTTQIGVDYSKTDERMYRARTNWTGMQTDGTPVGNAYRYDNRTTTKTLVQRLEYKKYIGLHTFSALAGLELNSRKYKTTGAWGTGFADDNHRSVGYAATINPSDTSVSEEKKASYFAQLSYNYDSRYYLVMTGRRDGSSTFGSDSRWGDFTSIGVNWNVKSDFLRDNKTVTTLRAGATYGKTGNSRIGSNDTYGNYSYSNTYIYDDQTGAVIANIPNRKLRWESALQTNLKLELGLFDRLHFLIEGYRKKTREAIVEVPTSRTTGEKLAATNAGVLLNEGIEATVSIDVIKNEKKGIYWTIDINAAHNRNKALKLYNENDRTHGNFIWREGYDINTFYLIRWAGVDPRDGAPLWYDAEGNITRTYSINNRVAWKSSMPDVTGGFRTSFKYRQYSLSALFTYSIGGNQFSTFSRSINSDGLNIGAQNQSVNQLDRWQQPGDVAVNPKPIWGVTTQSTMNSTRFVFNTTNMRLSNLVLGYELPQKTIERFRLKGATVQLIGNELLFVTPYDKKDRNGFKQSRSGYPLESSYLLAINVNF